MICFLGLGNLKTFCQIEKPEIEKIYKTGEYSGFFIVNVQAFQTSDSAIAKVKELRKTNKNVNYLWLPDYESLTNKQLFVVFLGPYQYQSDCTKALFEYKKIVPSAYAVYAQHSKTRIVVYSWSDIRIDGVKQFLILSYAKPEEENEYFQSGGEDWSWSQQDVDQHFDENYSNKVLTGNVYNGNLTDDEIKELEKKLDITPDSGFGFVLVKGKDFKFVNGYNPSSMVIDAAYEFFELDK